MSFFRLRRCSFRKLPDDIRFLRERSKIIAIQHCQIMLNENHERLDCSCKLGSTLKSFNLEVLIGCVYVWSPSRIEVDGRTRCSIRILVRQDNPAMMVN